ncbi:MAG: hypothetical protein QOH15_1018 [Gaiellales bacterium]|jgi:hypothetical protein|nr:hypothetical protein [Gaiellales bacterium]
MANDVGGYQASHKLAGAIIGAGLGALIGALLVVAVKSGRDSDAKPARDASTET